MRNILADLPAFGRELKKKHQRFSRFTLMVTLITLKKNSVHSERISTNQKLYIYNQCKCKINWCTLKINQSIITYFHIYQCTLLLNISVH